MDAEHRRLSETRTGAAPWRKWGPYLSERRCGAVRKDCGESGPAGDYFTHDQARARADRGDEAGLAGISDDQQLLCFALVLWNGKDPIGAASHGEDVRECCSYLDSTPTHSYMKYLCKYPQAVHPYADLIDTDRERDRHEFEYEMLDTAVSDQDRYFDVLVEYAKASPEDLLIQITVLNRGPDLATLHVLPTVWFRGVRSSDSDGPGPVLRQAGAGVIAASHPELGEQLFYAEGTPTLLFTGNETSGGRLVNSPNGTPSVKEGMDRRIVHGRQEAASAHYTLTIGSGESRTLRLRLRDAAPAGSWPPKPDPFGSDFDAVMRSRRQEADEFYATVIPSGLSAGAATVTRQALAVLWSLGLDDIGIVDRRAPLPTGGHRVRAGGPAWMTLFCQNMLEIAAELALERLAHRNIGITFLEHFLWIASAMVHAGADAGMWDGEDGFVRDVLRLPDGRAELALKTIRSANPGITADDLADWFREGLVAIPPWARYTLGPLLVKAGFDETRPIYLSRPGAPLDVTLHQERLV